MRLILSAVALIVGFYSSARADDVENPFKNVKVGEWIEQTWKLKRYNPTPINDDDRSDQFSGKIVFRRTITSKTDKEVKYRTDVISQESDGGEIDAKVHYDVNHIVIDLKKPVPLNAFGTYTQNFEETVKITWTKVNEAPATYKACGKEHQCTMTQLRANYQLNKKDREFAAKMWVAKSAPFNGLVHAEWSDKGGQFGEGSIELTSTGFGDDRAEKSAASKLSLAKSLLKASKTDASKEKLALQYLEAIVKDFPGTDAAKQAAGILKEPR
jgi:hypothetical protein